VSETHKTNGGGNGAAGPREAEEIEVPPLRTSRSNARAAEWSLVLEAAGIPHTRSLGPEGWELEVPVQYLARARKTLDAYDQENTRPAPAPAGPWAEPYGRSWIGFAAAIALTLFFGFTGPSDGTSAWSRLGSSAAERVLHGEGWRVVTALTLHADLGHLLGNALACLVFLTLLANRLGPGLAIWLALLAGASGNLLTAAVTRNHHLAIGASTAVFGALGGLVGLRVAPPHRPAPPAWMVLGAGAALFGMLGTGPGSDVLAHFFGLLSGAALGAAVALGGTPLRSRLWQSLLAVAAPAAVAICWALAFRRGTPL
jgi:membrane associated rhomboid family serine protease